MNDGGPAFPCTTGSDGGVFQEGMSVRQLYAGMAMMALIISGARPVTSDEAYEYADKLIQGTFK